MLEERNATSQIITGAGMLTPDSWTKVSRENTGYNLQTYDSKMVLFPRRVRHISLHATKTKPIISCKNFRVRGFDIPKTRF